MRPYKAIQPRLCAGRRRGTGGGLRPCLYVKGFRNSSQKLLVSKKLKCFWDYQQTSEMPVAGIEEYKPMSDQTTLIKSINGQAFSAKCSCQN